MLDENTFKPTKCVLCVLLSIRVVLIYLDCEQSVNDYLQSDEKNPVIPKR